MEYKFSANIKKMRLHSDVIKMVLEIFDKEFLTANNMHKNNIELINAICNIIETVYISPSKKGDKLELFIKIYTKNILIREFLWLIKNQPVGNETKC